MLVYMSADNIVKLAQAAVAMVSLTYSVNDGTNYNGTYLTPGTVNAPNLTCLMVGGGGCTGPIMSQARAHAYGDEATDAECGPYVDELDILKYKNDWGYYCKTTPNQQQFAYRFNEYNPGDKTKAYPRLTDRVITASSGECRVYTQDGDSVPRVPKDGSSIYPYTNGTYHGNITIPDWNSANEGTTYIYRDANGPAHAQEMACGPRCIIMWVHKAPGYGENSTFYECPITIGEVSNVKHDSERVPDYVARLAAASIGLSGRENYDHWRQYQLYSFGCVISNARWRTALTFNDFRTSFEIHFWSTDDVGAGIARFAIGTLSTLASTNPQIEVEGMVPHLGSRLQIHWYYLIPLLVGICAFHLALVLLGN